MAVKAFRKSSHPALHYQWMLADSERLRMHQRAIDVVVKPEDIVADLWTGTGENIRECVAGFARQWIMHSGPSR